MSNTMTNVVPMGVNLEAADVSGQNRVRVPNVQPNMAVGELIRGLVGKMGLASKDPNGRDLAYHARLEREGRHLNPAERVGDALQEGDRITLQPDIQAGRNLASAPGGW